MITYLKLHDIEAIPTAHAAGMKKVLSKGNIDLTRLTQIAWGSLKPEEEIPLHQHADMEECFFFIKGQGKIFINSREFELSEGVFLIVPPTAEHFLKCTGEQLEFFYFGLQVV
jgi:mannose-6-phosphate isomerase-like protein (cupin superfamily)